MTVQNRPRHFLVASDFDQTLSFEDSGQVLADLVGLEGFAKRVAGLSQINFVQQGAELAYLLRHDPEFRCVRREHLWEAGRRVRLKDNVREFLHFLQQGVEDIRFSFQVISAAPQEVVEAALQGLVHPDQIVATRFSYAESGEINGVLKVSAGYGKVAELERIQELHQVRPDHTIYLGDGSSDLHVMHQVNQGDGLTIAVSESQVTRVARRTVLSDNALSVLVPILEETLGWTPAAIREVFEPYGLVLREWGRARTDWLTLV